MAEFKIPKYNLPMSIQEKIELNLSDMYEPPINKIYSDIREQLLKEDERMTLEAVRNVGIVVDKEELIKALKYDRNQYEKGVKVGKSNLANTLLKVIEEYSNDPYFHYMVQDCLNIALERG